MSTDNPMRGHNRRPHGTRMLVQVVLCALLVTLGAVFYVWQRYQFVRLGFEVSRLREEKAHIEERLEPLQVEAQYLARPTRLDAVARQRLNMREPRPEQVYVLTDTRSRDGGRREDEAVKDDSDEPALLSPQ